MRVIICGGREYGLTREDDAWLETLDITHVRHGGARGADAGAQRWAMARGIPRLPYPADWSMGRAAGPRRNAEMLHDLLVDGDTEPIAVIAFEGGKGTADMVRRARAVGVRVITRETPHTQGEEG